MLNRTRQQEILLAFHSTFLSNIYFEKISTPSSYPFIEFEKIEEAYWNGLLEEVLPEVFAMKYPHRPTYIREVREYNSIMKIDITEFPYCRDNYLCIDPYKFLANQSGEANN